MTYRRVELKKNRISMFNLMHLRSSDLLKNDILRTYLQYFYYIREINKNILYFRFVPLKYTANLWKYISPPTSHICSLIAYHPCIASNPLSNRFYMPNPGVFLGSRKEFMLSQKKDYADGVIGGYVNDAIANIQRRYFK